MNTYVTTGTLSGSTVVLDEPLPKCEGKVRVTLEVLVENTAKPNFMQVLEQIWEAQRQRGHVPRSAEEIQAQIREERESWGD